MRHLALVILALFSIYAGAQEYRNVSVEEFEDIIYRPGVQILDVRTRAEFDEDHIIGAIPVDFKSSDFRKNALEALDKSAPVAVYCRSGNRSASAVAILAREGFELYHLTVGFNGWKAAGKPTAKVASAHNDNAVEARIRAAGMIDIHDLDSTIAVHLVYSQPYNFMGRVLYHGIGKAFMLPEMAEKVVKANRLLKSIRRDLNLIVYDACRPISVQWDMWNSVLGTDGEGYVGNPAKGNGLHNYGAAVDVTLMDCTGHPLPMGSEYDFFGAEARTDIEKQLLDEGRITLREYENRLLLRKVMTEAGFLTIQSEWWHFNLVNAATARVTLKIVK